MARFARPLVLAFLLTTARVGTCYADASAEDRAAAQALFDEGRTLVQAGKAKEACSKFEESERLDPSVGTQLNLADCYERMGATASAWTLYLEVESAARKGAQPERASLANSRAVALQTKLSRLVIVIPQANQIPGLVVERGTITVGRAQWGAPIPVDPGAQVVKVSAPGKKTWQTNIEIAADASTKTVTVPLLEDAPSDATPAQAKQRVQRTAAYIAGGVGVAGIVAGTVFGLRAMSKKSDAGCDGNVCDGNAQKDSYEQAQHAGTIATIAFAAGGAALAAGVVLYLTAPKDPANPETGIHALASAGPTGLTLSAAGSF
jgi:hypothetical protein